MSNGKWHETFAKLGAEDEKMESPSVLKGREKRRAKAEIAIACFAQTDWASLLPCDDRFSGQFLAAFAIYPGCSGRCSATGSRCSQSESSRGSARSPYCCRTRTPVRRAGPQLSWDRARAPSTGHRSRTRVSRGGPPRSDAGGCIQEPGFSRMD